jgi:hypothetical protein
MPMWLTELAGERLKMNHAGYCTNLMCGLMGSRYALRKKIRDKDNM